MTSPCVGLLDVVVEGYGPLPRDSVLFQPDRGDGRGGVAGGDEAIHQRLVPPAPVAGAGDEHVVGYEVSAQVLARLPPAPSNAS